MDKLGERITQDTETIKRFRDEAEQCELRAAKLRRRANEMERLIVLAQMA